MHRLSLGRRALAGLGLSFLCLNLVPATPAAAQAAPTPDQSYYWCSRQMTVHGTNVEYVSRVLVNHNPIAKGLAQDAIGQAFVRFLLKTYRPDNAKDEENSFYNWNYACKTSWPYGHSALDEPRKRALAAGAVEVNWEYTPDQDRPPPYAATSAPASPGLAHNSGVYASPAPATTPHPAAAPAPAPHPPAAQSHTVVATAAPPPAPRPAPRPAPSPTPPAPKPPKLTFVVCMAESDLRTKYINPPIDGGSGNASTWMKAYRAYLQPRYHYRGNIRCNRQPTRDGAQAFYEKMLEKTRELPGNGGEPPKIVVTEWK